MWELQRSNDVSKHSALVKEYESLKIVLVQKKKAILCYTPALEGSNVTSYKWIYMAPLLGPTKKGMELRELILCVSSQQYKHTLQY